MALLRRPALTTIASVFLHLSMNSAPCRVFSFSRLGQRRRGRRVEYVLSSPGFCDSQDCRASAPACISRFRPHQAFGQQSSRRMISQSTFDEGTSDDSQKWERMYSASASQTTQPSYETSEQVYNDYGTAGSSSSDVRVITFDLDNTLWKTGATITDAVSVINCVSLDDLIQEYICRTNWTHNRNHSERLPRGTPRIELRRNNSFGEVHGRDV